MYSAILTFVPLPCFGGTRLHRGRRHCHPRRRTLPLEAGGHTQLRAE